MANDGARMSTLAAASSASEEPWTIARLRELGVKLRSVNVLAHGELREPIDIKRLALLVRNADYKPRGFGALVLRFNEPKGSVLIYKSGKFVVVGSKTTDHARTIADKLAAVLEKVEYPSTVAKFVVANIVNATDLRFPLRLEGIAYKHAKHCQYEPELFPGLIYRLLEPQVTLLAFVSGKVVITGARTQEDAERAICKLFPVFLTCRMLRDMDDDSLSLSDDSEGGGGDGDDEAMRDDDDDDFLSEI